MDYDADDNVFEDVAVGSLQSKKISAINGLIGVPTNAAVDVKNLDPLNLDRRSLDERIKMLDEMMDKQQQKSKPTSLMEQASSSNLILGNKSTTTSLSSTSLSAKPLSKLFDLDEKRLLSNNNTNTNLPSSKLIEKNSSNSQLSFTKSNLNSGHSIMTTTATAASSLTSPNLITPKLDKFANSPIFTSAPLTKIQTTNTNSSALLLATTISNTSDVKEVKKEKDISNSSPQSHQQPVLTHQLSLVTSNTPTTPTSVQIAEKLGLKIKVNHSLSVPSDSQKSAPNLLASMMLMTATSVENANLANQLQLNCTQHSPMTEPSSSAQASASSHSPNIVTGTTTPISNSVSPLVKSILKNSNNLSPGSIPCEPLLSASSGISLSKSPSLNSIQTTSTINSNNNDILKVTVSKENKIQKHLEIENDKEVSSLKKEEVKQIKIEEKTQTKALSSIKQAPNNEGNKTQVSSVKIPSGQLSSKLPIVKKEPVLIEKKESSATIVNSKIEKTKLVSESTKVLVAATTTPKVAVSTKPNTETLKTKEKLPVAVSSSNSNSKVQTNIPKTEHSLTVKTSGLQSKTPKKVLNNIETKLQPSNKSSDLKDLYDSEESENEKKSKVVKPTQNTPSTEKSKPKVKTTGDSNEPANKAACNLDKKVKSDLKTESGVSKPTENSKVEKVVSKQEKSNMANSNKPLENADKVKMTAVSSSSQPTIKKEIKKPTLTATSSTPVSSSGSNAADANKSAKPIAKSTGVATPSSTSSSNITSKKVASNAPQSVKVEIKEKKDLIKTELKNEKDENASVKKDPIKVEKTIKIEKDEKPPIVKSEKVVIKMTEKIDKEKSASKAEIKTTNTVNKTEKSDKTIKENSNKNEKVVKDEKTIKSLNKNDKLKNEKEIIKKSNKPPPTLKSIESNSDSSSSSDSSIDDVEETKISSKKNLNKNIVENISKSIKSSSTQNHKHDQQSKSNKDSKNRPSETKKSISNNKNESDLDLDQDSNHESKTKKKSEKVLIIFY